MEGVYIEDDTKSSIVSSTSLDNLNEISATVSEMAHGHRDNSESNSDTTQTESLNLDGSYTTSQSSPFVNSNPNKSGSSDISSLAVDLNDLNITELGLERTVQESEPVSDNELKPAIILESGSRLKLDDHSKATTRLVLPPEPEANSKIELEHELELEPESKLKLESSSESESECEHESDVNSEIESEPELEQEPQLEPRSKLDLESSSESPSESECEHESDVNSKIELEHELDHELEYEPEHEPELELELGLDPETHTQKPKLTVQFLQENLDTSTLRSDLQSKLEPNHDPESKLRPDQLPETQLTSPSKFTSQQNDCITPRTTRGRRRLTTTDTPVRRSARIASKRQSTLFSCHKA